MLDHHNTLIIFIRPTYSEGLGNQKKNHSKHLVGSPFEVEVLPVTGCYIDHKNLSWHKKKDSLDALELFIYYLSMIMYVQSIVHITPIVTLSCSESLKPISTTSTLWEHFGLLEIFGQQLCYFVASYNLAQIMHL